MPVFVWVKTGCGVCSRWAVRWWRSSSSSRCCARCLITELRPAALDELGIRPAVEALVARTRATSGIDIELRMDLRHAGDRGELQLEPQFATTVYRFVQEALTNVVNHANAERVSVDILEAGPDLAVTVRDDGSGFGPKDRRDGGFGLIGMDERVSLVGGRLEIDSAPGHGTTVRARLPLRDAARRGPA